MSSVPLWLKILRKNNHRDTENTEVAQRRVDPVTFRAKPVSDITRLYVHDKHNTELLQRAIAVDALPDSWKHYFQEQLGQTIQNL